MTDKLIKLHKPVEWFGVPRDSVILREPTAGHLADFGEISLAIRTRDGNSYAIPQEDAINHYLDALLTFDGVNPIDGGGLNFLRMASLADGMEVRGALTAFFTGATLETAVRSIEEGMRPTPELVDWAQRILSASMSATPSDSSSSNSA